MKLSRAFITDLVICEPKIINDERGFFTESFRKNLLEDFIGQSLNICQENMSESKAGILRGLHFQLPPYAQLKLVSVDYGKILDVAVDLRKSSKYYGKYFSIILDDIHNKQLLIPKGFAHGFVVLSKTAKVSYKVDNYYNPSSERGLNYNDKALNINWQIDPQSIITAEKDRNYNEFDKNIFFK